MNAEALVVPEFLSEPLVVTKNVVD
eukprot:COSAG02_NODE_39161_length_420_cov_0.968847_1_plen_24_part_10